jgi:hypothetical protein
MFTPAMAEQVSSWVEYLIMDTVGWDHPVFIKFHFALRFTWKDYIDPRGTKSGACGDVFYFGRSNRAF